MQKGGRGVRKREHKRKEVQEKGRDSKREVAAGTDWEYLEVLADSFGKHGEHVGVRDSGTIPYQVRPGVEGWRQERVIRIKRPIVYTHQHKYLCMNNHIYSTLYKRLERNSDRRSNETEQRKNHKTHTHTHT